MIKIRRVVSDDWEQIKSIYEEGIATGNATFTTEAPDSFEAWLGKSATGCALVAEDGNKVVGWSKISPTSDRCVYVGVGEVSIYVGRNYRGHGVGNSLLQALIIASEQQGYWTLTAGIFPENQASIRLHTMNGFKMLGTRERIGKMKDIWRDVLLFERRSKVIGLD
jgi:L-amino acid N-acyltransferase YncA